jgi:ketosteroid isomerase-like protein
MSRENVELVRSIFSAWERGDFSSVEWAHPEIEWVIPDGLSPARWSGLAGLVEGERDFLRGWQNYHLEVDEYRELDDDRVLVLVHSSGRGRASGLELAEIGERGGAAWVQVRDGKVTKLVTYYDRERAFADLGLAPEE